MPPLVTRPLPADAGTRPTVRGPLVRSLLRSARPHQWCKNLLVLTAPAAAGALTDPATTTRAIIATLACCLVASAGYLVNDLRDIDADRRHPTKRLRPIAAGLLSPAAARRTAIATATLGVAVTTGLSPAAGALLVTYLLLVVAYSRSLKRIAYVEIGVVGAGFLLRAAIGGAATHLALSRAFLLVVGATAVLAVTGKRRGEQRVLGRTASTHRSVLAAYPPSVLAALAIAAAAVAVGAYGLWAIRFDEGVALSLLPFTFVVVRYAHLAVTGDASDPFDLLRHDRALRLAAALWLLATGVGIYLT